MRHLLEDPSRLWGSVVAVVGAVVAFLVAQGVVTPDTEEHVVSLLTAAGPLVTALLTAYLISRRAYKPSTVDRIVDDQVNERLLAEEEGPADG